MFWIHIKGETEGRAVSHKFESHWKAQMSDHKFVYLSPGENKQGIALNLEKKMVYFFVYFSAGKVYHFSRIRSCYYQWSQTGTFFVVQVKDIDNPELRVSMHESEAKKWEEIFRQYVFRY